ncbi:MAG: hypothetical protein KJ556_21595 [Gammaproteobacteria bacterium]|nr:hypothetical protein [Gammaproteobacteria bacterium]
MKSFDEIKKSYLHIHYNILFELLFEIAKKTLGDQEVCELFAARGFDIGKPESDQPLLRSLTRDLLKDLREYLSPEAVAEMEKYAFLDIDKLPEGEEDLPANASSLPSKTGEAPSAADRKNSAAIYISTLGRGPQKQTTWGNISPEWRKNTKLVITPEEEEAFRGMIGLARWAIEKDEEANKQLSLTDDHLIVLPPEVKGLSACRQWILDNAPEDIIIYMDDDLTFYYLGNSPEGMIWNGARFLDEDLISVASPSDVSVMVDHLVNKLTKDQDLALAGIHPARLVGVKHESIEGPWWDIDAPAMRCYAIKTKVFRAGNVRFDNHRLLQDFSVVLQLLSQGHHTAIANCWGCYDDGPIVAQDGGVSVYRNPLSLIATAMELGLKYPDEIAKMRKYWEGLV